MNLLTFPDIGASDKRRVHTGCLIQHNKILTKTYNLQVTTFFSWALCTVPAYETWCFSVLILIIEANEMHYFSALFW